MRDTGVSDLPLQARLGIEDAVNSVLNRPVSGSVQRDLIESPALDSSASRQDLEDIFPGPRLSAQTNPVDHYNDPSVDPRYSAVLTSIHDDLNNTEKFARYIANLMADAHRLQLAYPNFFDGAAGRTISPEALAEVLITRMLNHGASAPASLRTTDLDSFLEALRTGSFVDLGFEGLSHGVYTHLIQIDYTFNGMRNVMARYADAPFYVQNGTNTTDPFFYFRERFGDADQATGGNQGGLRAWDALFDSANNKNLATSPEAIVALLSQHIPVHRASRY